jgi:hypothetical protein
MRVSCLVHMSCEREKKKKGIMFDFWLFSGFASVIFLILA